jgi:hypothetical protein
MIGAGSLFVVLDVGHNYSSTLDTDLGLRQKELPGLRQIIASLSKDSSVIDILIQMAVFVYHIPRCRAADSYRILSDQSSCEVGIGAHGSNKVRNVAEESLGSEPICVRYVEIKYTNYKYIVLPVHIYQLAMIMRVLTRELQ